MSQSNREHETRPNELLQTKFALPRLHTSIVPRDSQLSALNNGLERKLTLISAPAGFGKTTLVGEWIALGREQRNLRPVAWVSLDPNDNDPVRFWRYVLTASRAFEDEIGKSALAFLNNSPQPPFEQVFRQ